MKWGWLLLGMLTPPLAVGGLLLPNWLREFQGPGCFLSPASETVTVMSVVRTVAPGEPITEDVAMFVNWPAASVPPDAIVDPGELPLVAGRVLEEMQPLQQHHLAPPTVAIQKLPAGVAPIKVFVRADASLEHFVSLGTAVDIIDPVARNSVTELVVIDVVKGEGGFFVTVLVTAPERSKLTEWSAAGSVGIHLSGCDFAGTPRWHDWVDLQAWRSATYVRWCHLEGGLYVDEAGHDCAP